MSLTHPHINTERLIKASIKNCIPNKNQFYSFDKTKCFDTKKESVIEYGLPLSNDAALCGTAFDYLARFIVARIVSDNKDAVLKKLVAERFITSSSFYTITIDDKTKKKYESKSIRMSIPGGVLRGNVYAHNYWKSICDIPLDEIEKLMSKGKIIINDLSIDETKKIRATLRRKYRKLLTPIEKYINGETVDESSLIDTCLILSKMELTVRGGIGVIEISNLFISNSNDTVIKNELTKMLDSFKKTFLPLINEDSEVVYNPHFGIGSQIIGGADADIFIDGTLYDFKTSIKNGWSSSDVTQLIGYFILDAVAKKCDCKENWLSAYTIKKVALYKVRYEEIAFFDISEISSNLLENTLKNICCTYLMRNMSHLISDKKLNTIKSKYNFPLTKKELRFCSDMYAEDLNDFLEDGDNLPNFLKKERDEIQRSHYTLKIFLDSIDIFSFFRDVV